jgi:hypothetical protein
MEFLFFLLGMPVGAACFAIGLAISGKLKFR